MQETVLVVTIVTSVAIVCVLGYLLGADHKRRVTRSVENPGYRNPALVQELKGVPMIRLLMDMPRAVKAIFAMNLLLLGITLIAGKPAASHWIGRVAEDVYDAAPLRFDEVPDGFRGVVVDRFNRPTTLRVLTPGRHFVWGSEHIAQVDCLHRSVNSLEVRAETSDGVPVTLRLRADVRLSCYEDSIFNLVNRNAGFDTGPDDGWRLDVVPSVRREFDFLIRSMTAQEAREREIEIQAMVWVYAHSSFPNSTWSDMLTNEVLLPESAGTGPESRARGLSGFEFPSMEGWSTSVFARDHVLFRDQSSSTLVSMQFLSDDDADPEEIINGAADSGDRVYAGRVIHAGVGRTASGDLYLFRALGAAAASHYEYVTVLPSGRPGVRVYIYAVCREGDIETMMGALDRIIARVRPTED